MAQELLQLQHYYIYSSHSCRCYEQSGGDRSNNSLLLQFLQQKTFSSCQKNTKIQDDCKIKNANLMINCRPFLGLLLFNKTVSVKCL